MKRSWFRFHLNLLWMVAAGYLVGECIKEHSWWGLFFGLCWIDAVWEGYQALWPRCPHDREELVGLCGDERTVARVTVPHPFLPGMNSTIKGTIQSGKFHCKDCGRIRLVKPTKGHIAAFRKQVESVANHLGGTGK